MKNTITKFLLVLLTLSICFTVRANPYLLTNNNTEPSYVPRLYLGGYGGTAVLGEADILAPILLRTNYNNLFVYGQGRYSHDKRSWVHNPWTGSLGLGYRQIVANTALLGVYVLGDRTNSPTSKRLWQISPGIEILGRVFDFRANGYFPLGDKYWKNEGWADDFGDFSHITCSCHSQYDYWYVYNQEVGIGGDSELGSKLFKVKNTLVKAFLNGYYFEMKHNDSVVGGGAKITIQPNTYLEISLADSYDNYEHNVFMAGVRVSIYDLFATNKVLDDRNLQRRLFEPIDRNFASLGSASSVRIAAPSKPSKMGPGGIERDNLWFFDGTPLTAVNAELGNGTYEHPYIVTQYTQDTIDFIHTDAITRSFPTALLYFSPGTFNSYTASTPSYAPIGLYSNETMWGRMNGLKGFLQPATGATRALFIGGLTLATDVSLNDLRVENNATITGFTQGVTMNGITNVAINDVTVGTNNASTGYPTGIYMNNSSATFTNSAAYGYNTSGIAYGLYDVSVGNVTLGNLSGCVFTGTSTTANGYGVYAFSSVAGGNVTIGDVSNSTFTGTAGTGGISEIGYGLLATTLSGNATIGNIADSHFTGTGVDGNGYGLLAQSSSGGSVMIGKTGGSISDSTFTGNSTNGYGYGLFAYSSTAGSITIENVSDSDFDGNGARGYGLDASGGSVTIGNISANSVFDGDGANGSGYGLYANVPSGAGTIEIGNISDSDFTGNSASTNAYGLYAYTNGNIDIGSITGSGGSTVFTGDGGTGIGDTGYGLYAKSFAGTVKIADAGTILGSTFYGTSEGNSYGFYADGSGTVTIGTISGSDFLSDSNSGNTYGLYALSSTANVSIGDILNNSAFDGTGSVASGNGYGLYASAAGTIGIGNIDDSDFIGVGGTGTDDGAGLYAKASSTITIGTTGTGISGSTFNGDGGDSGYGLLAASSSGDITIGTGTTAGISNSTFLGDGTNALSAGLYAYSTSGDVTVGTGPTAGISSVTFEGDGSIGYGLNAFSSSGSINIGDIASNSSFTGDGTAGDGCGLRAYNVNSPGTVTIGDIADSDFTGNSTSDQAFGLQAYADGSVTIGDISGTAGSTTFTGNTTGTDSSDIGWGLYAYSHASYVEIASGGSISGANFEGDGYDGYGLWTNTPLGGGYIDIGNIENSDFSATGNAGYGYGFNASTASSSYVDIGNISLNSTFMGHGEGTNPAVDNGWGLYAASAGGNVKIGTIDSSLFTGRSDDANAYGLYAGTTVFGNVEIGAITGNGSGSTVFTGAGNAGYGLWAKAASGFVKIADTVNISGANFIGTGSSDDGCGLYASTSSGNVDIGNILNSSFTGTGGDGPGDVGYGLYAKSLAGNVEIGLSAGISGADFIGTGFSNSYGFYANTPIGGGYIDIGDISNSDFSGIGDQSSGYGFSASTDSANFVHIGNISLNSTFFGEGKGILATHSGYGLYVASSSGDITIKDIDQTTFTGRSNSGNSFGLCAETDSGTITIADGGGENISRSDFNGSVIGGTSVDSDGYGLYAKKNGGAGNVNIGDILYSDFTGAVPTTGDDGCGLCAENNGTGDVNIGNIEGDGATPTSSTVFSGTGGGSSADLSCGLSAKTTTGDVNIGTADEGGISGATFIGNAGDAFGLHANSTAGGSVNIATGTNGKISNNSVFTGTGAKGGYGLFAEASSGDVTIGDIDDSIFTGSGIDKGYGLWAETPAGNVSIGYIKNNSDFDGTGTDPSGSGYGLWAKAAGVVTIGDIDLSTFTGTGADTGYGLYAESTASSITIGATGVTRSTFIGNATAAIGSTTGIGFYANATFATTVGTALGSVNSNVFTGTTTSVTGLERAIDLWGSTGPNVTIDGKTFTTPTISELNSAYSQLTADFNDLSGSPPGSRLCVNGICSTSTYLKPIRMPNRITHS